MQIHRSAHTRSFTVVSNAVLQDHRLSFVARGILGYLLSLRDGTQADVRSLAKLCKTGRDQIAGALNELKERGYYVVERVQDAATGRWVTRTVVRENPQAAPAAGCPAAGDSGITPQGVNTEGEPPPTPRRTAPRPAAKPAPRPSSSAPSSPAPSSSAPSSPGPTPPSAPDEPQLTPVDASLIRRVAQIDPRLRIGEAEAAPLVPLLAQWRERGVEENALVYALTAGLPERVFAPARFVAARLTRKLPPRTATPPPSAATLSPQATKPSSQAVRTALTARPAPECEECARPLPAGRTGRCGACERPPSHGEIPWASIARAGRARARAAVTASGVRPTPATITG